MRTVATVGLALLFLVGCGAGSTTNWNESALTESADQTVYQFLDANSSLEFVSGPDGGLAMKLPGQDQFVGLFVDGELRGQTQTGKQGVYINPYVPDVGLLTDLRVGEVAEIKIERVAGGYGEYYGAVRITTHPSSDSASDTSQ